MVTPFVNVANNIASTLLTGVGASDTVIPLAPGAGAIFPAAPFYVSCEFEVMRCQGKAGDSLTVSRGQDGTTATAHSGGAILELRGNAALWRDIANAVNNIENGTTLPPAQPVADSVRDIHVAPDAAIQKTKLAGYPFGPGDLSPAIAKANLLTNGGFQVWQRGASFIQPHGVVTADRWESQIFAGNVTIQRAADINAAGYSMLISTDAAALTLVILQKLEADTVAELRGAPIVFSVRLHCNQPGVSVSIDIQDNLGTIASAAYTTVNAWQKLYAAAVVPTSATNLVCRIVLSGSGAVAQAHIGDATLVVGTQGSDYVPMHPQEELARCQRYYEIIGGDAPSILGGASSVGENWGQTLYYQKKAASPSATRTGNLVANGCTFSNFDRITPNCLRWYVAATIAGAFECSFGGTYLLLETNP